jgi:hypothetical protein
MVAFVSIGSTLVKDDLLSTVHMLTCIDSQNEHNDKDVFMSYVLFDTMLIDLPVNMNRDMDVSSEIFTRNMTADCN